MKIAMFSTKGYDRRSFERVNQKYGHELTFFEARLTPNTAPLAVGYEAVCVFVNDDVNREAIIKLAAGGTRIIATRSAGYNQIDLEAAEAQDLCVVRVPAYSPNAVSEFTVGLMLTLGRQIHRAYNRVRDTNFELEGLQGFELHEKTVAVFGTGKIGTMVIKNLSGFGCRILAYDLYRNPEVEKLAEYIDDPIEIIKQADILTFHMPLTPETYHIINQETMPHLKDGVFIINTSRGALLDTKAVIEGLKSGKIGYLAIDVYEVESDLFFRDLSNEIVTDDVFARLLTFPNVLVTGHQAFLTDRALHNIADTTLNNITQFEQNCECANTITMDKVRGQ
ncbi:MAG: 2-hydroxyacid dehydrogenase [Anaerolineae bacterium]|nr:2-hydroxyacid dehydrogenase [Anaerolineae bacterium]